MCGVTVMGIEAGRIAWGRLYMEVVERVVATSTRWCYVPSADVGLTVRPVGAARRRLSG